MSTASLALRLPPERSAPRAARHFVAGALEGWQLNHATDTVLLLTSELVTNAVLHAGSPVEVVVEHTDELVRVSVHDEVERPPQPRRNTGNAEVVSGRGLSILETLATSWGVCPERGGKSVWFEVPMTTMVA